MTTMTVTEVRLPEALQGLIDARLDTIDRMLLGRLPRGERMAIVGQVEEQIHEMLGEHQGDDWSREDVLDVLSRLDPPEAYLPEMGEFGAVSRPSPSSQPAPRSMPARRSPGASPARLGGILGIIGLVLALFGPPLLWGICMLMSDELPLFLGGGLIVPSVLVMATIGLVHSIRHRDGGGWSISGLILNIVAMVVTLMTSLTCLLLFIS